MSAFKLWLLVHCVLSVKLSYSVSNVPIKIKNNLIELLKYFGFDMENYSLHGKIATRKTLNHCRFIR